MPTLKIHEGIQRPVCNVVDYNTKSDNGGIKYSTTHGMRVCCVCTNKLISVTINEIESISQSGRKNSLRKGEHT